MGSQLRRFGRRLLVMVGGEAMQSAFHLGLNIALLHVLAPQDYGVFALVMVIGGLGLTYIRSLTAMPASVFIGASRSKLNADLHDVTFGSGAIVLAGLIALTTMIALKVWLGSSAVVGGLFVGLWSLRSHIRTAIFARSQTTPVAIGDAVYTASGGLLATLLLLAPSGGLLPGILAVLALANAFGIATMLIARGRLPRISLRRSVLRRLMALRRQLGWSFVSVTTTNLQGQGLALLVASMAGPAAYAPIAGIFVLFAPLRIVSTAVVNMIQPVLSAHLVRQESAKLWHQMMIWTGALFALAVLFGATVMLALPHLSLKAFESTPTALIGGSTWAIYAAVMLYVAPRVTLEALGAFRTIGIITAIGASVGTAAIAAILVVAGAEWSLLGALASELIVLGLSWAVVRRKIAVPSLATFSRASLFGRGSSAGSVLP